MSTEALTVNFPPRTKEAGPTEVESPGLDRPAVGPTGFSVQDKVEYFSSTHKQWMVATITHIHGPHIMLDVKPGQWLGPADIEGKVRKPAATSATPTGLRVGDRVMYYSTTMGRKLLVTVTAVSPTGDIMMDVKPGAWISLKEQEEKITLLAKPPAAVVEPAAAGAEVARCSRGHPLTFVGTTDQAWCCNAVNEGGCKTGMTLGRALEDSMKIPRWQCKHPGCDYDLCSACAQARASSSGDEGAFGVAPTVKKVLLCPSMHEMTFCEEQSSGWICGAARELSGCASGIAEPVPSPGLSRYICPEGCDYSLCARCATRRFTDSSRTTIAPAGPKVDFKAPKAEIADPKTPKGGPPGDLSIGSIILDPHDHLEDLPHTVFHGKHQHPLKLKVASEANKFNIWKRVVAHGHSCDVCGTSGHTDYYKCIFGCRWYCCLECAKRAATYGLPGQEQDSSAEDGSRVRSDRPKLEDLTDLQRDFYRQLEKVATKDFKGDLGIVSPDRVFAKYDANHDKSIDREEMENVVAFIYKNLGLDVPKERMVDMIFDSHCKDNSGTVSMKNFPALYKRICLRALGSFTVLSKDDLAKRAKGEFRAKYELGKRLSAGVGGVTYLATNKKSGLTVVVKRPFDMVKIEDFELLKDKSHPNIVRVFELFTSQTETFIVMECCAGGDLFGAIEHCFEHFGGLSYNFIGGVMRQALTGVNYLHSEFLQCHNDLKPENVLLEATPKSLGDIPRAMIADFGEVSDQNAAGHGDPRYAAPEVWARADGRPGSFATAESDVWGLGVMFFELLSGGNLPFIKHRNLSNFKSFVMYRNAHLYRVLQQAILTPNAQPDYTEITAAGPYAVDLCKGMLAYNRGDRIKIRKALEHPYFDILKADVEPLDAKLGEVLKRRGNLSTLKIALLNFVASRMQGESLDHFQKIWQQFDFQNEGVLREEPFVQMLVEKLEIPEARAHGIFSLADVDSNGAVDFNEFVGVLFDPTYMDTEQLESHLQGVFMDMADANGKLDFRTFVSIFPASHSRSVLQAVFGEMDKDNDGVVEWEEFKECMEQM